MNVGFCRAAAAALVPGAVLAVILGIHGITAGHPSPEMCELLWRGVYGTLGAVWMVGVLSVYV